MLYSGVRCSHLRPRNPFIVHYVSTTPVLLVDGCNFAAHQYDHISCRWWSWFPTTLFTNYTCQYCNCPLFYETCVLSLGGNHCFTQVFGFFSYLLLYVCLFFVNYYIVFIKNGLCSLQILNVKRSTLISANHTGQ